MVPVPSMINPSSVTSIISGFSLSFSIRLLSSVAGGTISAGRETSVFVFPVTTFFMIPASPVSVVTVFVSLLSDFSVTFFSIPASAVSKV